MTGRRRWPPEWTLVLLAGWVLAGLWIALLASGASQFAPTSRPAFVTDYNQRVLDDGLELLIVQSDGQAYAALARDPFLERVHESFGDAAEASYRAQRPLLGWLSWMLSLGRSGWVPPALAVVSAFGAGLAAAGAGALLQRRGRSAWWGLAVVVLPGTANALSFLGPEPLMLGLALWALVAWEDGHSRLAVALFCAAVLCRESALLVPAGLGLHLAMTRQFARAVMLLPTPLTVAAWAVALRINIGSWPWAAGEGRLGPPLAGFLDAVPDRWATPEQNAGVLALGVLVVLGAVLVARSDYLTVIVVLHAVFATFMGKYVWEEIPGYGRVLLPMYALGMIAIAGALTFDASRDRAIREPPEPVRLA